MAAKFSPQAVLSSKADGYDVQFEELKGGIFVCRNCSYHIQRGDARMMRAASAIKHLSFHQEDGHRIDPGAIQLLRDRL